MSVFAARDWDAMAEHAGRRLFEDDRRRVVNAGIRHGRDAEIESSRAAADLGITMRHQPSLRPVGNASSSLRIALLGSRPRRVQNDVLQIVEIDADERITANVVFDLDDIDAAFEELDARYLAGEAAAHAHTWSVIAEAFAAVNRHELPESTPDWVNIDHRRAIAFAPGDMTAYIHATLDDRAGHQGLHRGCASAEQPRSGRHPGGRTRPRKRASTPSGG